MESPDAQRPLGPTQEGSDHAMLVLRRMCEWKAPISSGEIAAITGLDPKQLILVLRGLKARHRIVCDGHGAGARWQLAHLAKADGP